MSWLAYGKENMPIPGEEYIICYLEDCLGSIPVSLWKVRYAIFQVYEGSFFWTWGTGYDDTIGAKEGMGYGTWYLPHNFIPPFPNVVIEERQVCYSLERRIRQREKKSNNES